MEKRKWGILILLVILIVIGLFFSFRNQAPKLSKDSYLVVRVVDGDTIEIRMGEAEERVRLIGIDAPESVHPDAALNSAMGVRAAEYLSELLDGKNVRLELDTQERDRYGRLLAYVYSDDVLVNEQMVEAGMAVVATYPPKVRYVDRFVEAERRARENGVGLWE